MKRLALVVTAAATILGTGCGPSTSSAPCVSSVTLDWSGGFKLFDGSVGNCGQAGVASVDLFINNDPNTGASFPCAQLAAQAVDVGPGTNLFTVEGVEPGTPGRIAFRAEVSVGSVCGNQNVRVTPSEGTLAIDYSLPSNACFAPDSLIWSEVRDDIANQIAFVDKSSSSPACAPSPAAGPTYLLPAGNYTLMGVNEYSYSSGGIVGADCTQTPFVIGGAATTTVPATIVNSHAACF